VHVLGGAVGLELVDLGPQLLDLLVPAHFAGAGLLAAAHHPHHQTHAHRAREGGQAQKERLHDVYLHDRGRGSRSI